MLLKGIASTPNTGCVFTKLFLGKKEKRPFLSQKVAERFNHRSEELAKCFDSHIHYRILKHGSGGKAHSALSSVSKNMMERNGNGVSPFSMIENL
jgi:hypothetical protein